jgi:hypothetical protein
VIKLLSDMWKKILKGALTRWFSSVGSFIEIRHEADPRRNVQIHVVRPKETLHIHVFKILVDIDVLEDLMFYH